MELICYFLPFFNKLVKILITSGIIYSNTLHIGFVHLQVGKNNFEEEAGIFFFLQHHECGTGDKFGKLYPYVWPNILLRSSGKIKIFSGRAPSISRDAKSRE